MTDMITNEVKIADLVFNGNSSVTADFDNSMIVRIFVEDAGVGSILEQVDVFYRVKHGHFINRKQERK